LALGDLAEERDIFGERIVGAGNRYPAAFPQQDRAAEAE
jgi:hypothetical protein